MTRLRVGVLFGGRSSDHDISCDAAAGVLTHLNRDRFDPVPVRIDEDGTWHVAPAGEIPDRLYAAELKELTSGPGSRTETLASAIPVLESVDVVYPVLSGMPGEYGAVLGLLDLLGVPCVGCCASAGVIGTDPEFTGAVLRAVGFDTTVLVERPVPARNIGVSVLQHPDGRVVASPPVPEVDAEVGAAVADIATRVFRALGCTGLAGIDFVVRRDGDRTSIVLDEIATLPGLTAGSPYLTVWESTGLSYTDLLDVLIDTGLAQCVRGSATSRRAAAQVAAAGSGPADSSSSTAPQLGIMVYGCEDDEAALFRSTAPRLGVLPNITESPVTEANVELAYGHRHISVSHKYRIANDTLLALSQIGVEYISTRSIGFNHIDTMYAKSVGITVGNSLYSADSVADYTLMLMLMAIRDAKSVVRRGDLHDYRLHDARGKELRDLTVGVVGTGRIGSAVIDRLRAFGGKILAYDTNPKAPAVNATLDELLRQSDIVTLHTPLTADTHHLLNRPRIERMKHGAYVINTGRGPLLDTEALISALENGSLGGAALDVIEGEEGIFYADCSNRTIENKALLRLQEMPNVFISPHTAYYTDHALSDTIENSIMNCLKFESEKQRG